MYLQGVIAASPLRPLVLVQDVSELARPLPPWLTGTPVLVDRRGTNLQFFVGADAVQSIQVLLSSLQASQSAPSPADMGMYFCIEKPSAPPEVFRKYQEKARGVGISEGVQSLQARRAPGAHRTAQPTDENRKPPESWYE